MPRTTSTDDLRLRLQYNIGARGELRRYIVQRACDAEGPAVQDMHVEFGSAHVLVAEQLLNRSDVMPALE
jgi:hypothetical protein